MENKFNTFKEDLLDRKNLAINLTKIIENDDDISVLAIDSSWGTGKTTFIKMWQDMILTEDDFKGKFETLYFNAWENDYIKDPFLALLSEIEKLNYDKSGKVKKVFDKIIENGKKIARPIINVPMKLLSAGSVGVEDLKLGNLNESVFESILDQKKLRETFIDELQQYSEDDEINMIFFIDELDRCRPTFAVELLEVIKHLFKSKNITFVISVDKEQLSYSIGTLYGQGMDSDGYLRRFFDVEYKIPIVNKRDYIKFKNENVFKNYQRTDFLEGFLEEIFNGVEYSFRDIDKTYNYIKLIVPLIELFYDNSINWKDIYVMVYSHILAEMINIKIKHGTIYKKIINLDYSFEEAKSDNILKLDRFKNAVFDFSGFHDLKVKEIIYPTMKVYLNVVKLTENGKRHIAYSEPEEEGFTVGLKNDQGSFVYNYKINIHDLLMNNKLNIINTMEFLDSFNISS